ncbi:hypothetical protein AC1031_006228 [Aphanomyces cochlioides]|nr:hypothetical protein AC1031_006228 [Aphanomyces cochlioides]
MFRIINLLAELESDLTSPTWQEYSLASPCYTSCRSDSRELRIASTAVFTPSWRALVNLMIQMTIPFECEPWSNATELCSFKPSTATQAIHAPFRPVGKARWDAFNSVNCSKLSRELESQNIDEHTVCRTLRQTNATGEIHSYYLVRPYCPTDNRELVFWSTEFNDEHIPHMDHSAVNNERGW